MTDAFSCPTCGAPLTPDGSDAATLICPFCRNSVIVPEEMRHYHHKNEDQAGGADHTVADEVLLPQIRNLLASNQKIEAIKLLRQNFSIGLKDAKDAVEQIETGQRSSLADLASRFSYTPTLYGPPPKRASTARFWLILSLIIFLLGLAIFLVAPSHQEEPALIPTNTLMPLATPLPTLTPTPQFASFVSTFGGEGTGAGKFSEPRDMAIAQDGTLYVADYKGNRVQVFDPSGKFVVQWTLDPDLHLHHLAAGLNGELYAIRSGRIFRYDRKTGQLSGEVTYQDVDGTTDDFDNMAVALDGSLLASWINYDLEKDLILRFDPSGKLVQTIENAVQDVTGEFEHQIYLAVDGLGNIYAMGEYNTTVCVYSPQGKLIARFGSKGDKPGQFSYPENIAIDSRGRVYVSEYLKVHVFDPGGLYLDTFTIDGGGYDMAFDSQDNLYLVDTSRVMRYVLNR